MKYEYLIIPLFIFDRKAEATEQEPKSQTNFLLVYLT